MKASKPLAQLIKTPAQCISHVFVCMANLCSCTSEINHGTSVLTFIQKNPTWFCKGLIQITASFLQETCSNISLIHKYKFNMNCVLSYLCQWLKLSGCRRWKGTQIKKHFGKVLGKMTSVKFHKTPKQKYGSKELKWTHSLRPWSCPDWQKDRTDISEEPGNRILVWVLHANTEPGLQFTLQSLHGGCSDLASSSAFTESLHSSAAELARAALPSCMV